MLFLHRKGGKIRTNRFVNFISTRCSSTQCRSPWLDKLVNYFFALGLKPSQVGLMLKQAIIFVQSWTIIKFEKCLTFVIFCFLAKLWFMQMLKLLFYASEWYEEVSKYKQVKSKWNTCKITALSTNGDSSQKTFSILPIHLLMSALEFYAELRIKSYFEI